MAQQTALVTGASAGIGAELAKLCAADGCNVVLVARNAERLAVLAGDLARAHNIQARVLAADLADSVAPAQVFEQLQSTPIDILINNAGFGLRGAFAEMDWAADAGLMQVNMTAPVHLTKLFLPAMLQRKRGRILNVASTAAFVPGPFMALYYASKAFLLSFSESIANEVKGTGVTVTVLCPGPTRTEFFERAGITGGKLSQGPSMTAADVAGEGYRAMMAGKTQVIAGARNRWLMRGARIAPRGMVAGVTRRLNLE
jgi:short-subunit dehydrogenase